MYSISSVFMYSNENFGFRNAEKFHLDPFNVFEYILISDFYTGPLNVSVNKNVGKLKRGVKKPSLKHNNILRMK